MLEPPKDGDPRPLSKIVQDAYHSDQVKFMYGPSADYDMMLSDQNGACAICKRKPPGGKYLEVDHDHITGTIRGLLCGGCNKMLGFAKDNEAVLISGAVYLRKRR